MFDKIADFIMKHSKAIVIVWVILLLLSVYPLMHVGDVMKYDLNSMANSDSESMRGLDIMGKDFIQEGSGLDASSLQIIVLKYDIPQGSEENANKFLKYLNEKNPIDSKIKSFVDARELGLDVKPGAVLAGAVYKDGYTAVQISDDTPALRDYINKCKAEFVKTCPNETLGFNSYLTGTPAIGYDMKTNSLADVARIDPITVLLILILVGLFFRSFITSATPPVTIGIAFAVTACAIFFIGQALNIYFITQMMILVAMMGAGCDYCIFIMARYREERRGGKDHHDALREAIIWAGESIATSGLAVIIGFGAMALCSYSMVSTMGLCLALGILIALLAALTLIPSIINLVGDRIFWPTRMNAFEKGGKATKGWYAWFGRIGNKYFHWSAKFALKHAVVITVVAILITIPATYFTLTNQTSYDMVTSMQSGESGEGYKALGEYANFGMLMPSYVLLEYGNGVAVVEYEPTPEGKAGLGKVNWKESFITNDKEKLDGLLYDIESSDTDNIIPSALGSIIHSPLFIWDDMMNTMQIAGDAAVQYLKDHPDLPKDEREMWESIAVLATSDGKIAALKTISPAFSQIIDGIAAAKGWNNNDLVEKGGPYMDYQINCVVLQTLGGSFASAEKAPAVPYNADMVKITITTKESSMSIRSMQTLDTVRGVVDNFVKNNSDVSQKWFTGSAVVMKDVSNVFAGEFRIIEIVVVVLILLLLFFVMKSYLIPIRSVLTILMSITWTLALTYFIFVNVMGGQLTWLAPMVLLVICLGLGMDYDILLTTRIKENVTKGMSNDEAIKSAVTSTGSVITICGLIMGGAFGTLMLSGMEMLQEFGFALCFAILIDALVIRTYVVPAVMHLLGDWNWKGPKFLKRKQA